MNIGIFSGTFDPVHQGHIWLAQTAIEKFGLDKVLFLPEPKPRRKTPEASYEHRRAMLEIVTQNDDRLDVLDISTNSHNVKSTLQFVEQQYGATGVLKIIMGADVFENINKWNNFNLLKERAGFIVCLRKKDDGKLVLDMARKLGVDIELVSSEYSLVSSSKVRDELTKEKTPKGISRDIYEYIKDNKLYEAK